MKPLISIIIPCYKAEKTIGTIIDNVLSQTYTNWEIIVVSNGKRRTAQEKIVSQYTKHGCNIKLISSEKGGVSFARNLGIEKANGEYLTFVDADDQITPQHIQLLTDALCCDTDIVVGGYTLFRVKENNKIVYPIDLTTPFHGRKKYIMDVDSSNKGPVWNKLYKTNFLRNSNILFREDLTIYEDAVFNFELAKCTDNFSFCRLTGYMYLYYDSDSAMTKYSPTLEKSWLLINSLLRDLKLMEGYSPEILHKQKQEEAYYLGFQLVNNLYRNNSPYRFNDIVREIDRIIFKNKDFAVSYAKVDKSNHNLFYKIFDVLYSLNSPLIMSLGVKIEFFLKRNLHQVYSKVVPWLRGKDL